MVPVVPLFSTGKYWLFLKNKDRKTNVMDKIWDRKSFEVDSHWLVWRGWNTEWPRRTDRSRTLKNKNKKNGIRSTNCARCPYVVEGFSSLKRQISQYEYRLYHTQYVRCSCSIFTIIECFCFRFAKVSTSHDQFSLQLTNIFSDDL